MDDEADHDLLPGDRTNPITALRTELIYLWSDLARAYRYSRATPAKLSVGCEDLIARIRRVTRIVGPVDRGEVEAWFLETGMYEQVHAGLKPLGPLGGTDDLGAMRDRINAALIAEHYRRVHEQIVASPEAHQAAFTAVVVEAVRVELERLQAGDVRGVQGWMALDLHIALGLAVDHGPGVVHQGRPSWGDWWAELLARVRTRHPC